MFQQSTNRDFRSAESSNTKWQLFWSDAFAIQGSITPHVLPNVACTGIIAAAICGIAYLSQQHFGTMYGKTKFPCCIQTTLSAPKPAK